MKRIFKKIFQLTDNVSHENGTLNSLNIIKGKNVIIERSAIITCSEKGKIEFEGDNYVGRNVEIGGGSSIFLGTNTSIQDRCILLGDIEIGRYCLFAPNVYLSSGRHYYGLKPELYIKDQDTLVQNDPELAKNHSKKIIIEDDCWLGINVVVMSGVTIGKGSVIGANSVVTKNVEPYSIMSGSPATLLKKRLSFELKDKIDFSNDADLPYFYNGFYTNLKRLQEDRKVGGVGAMNNFSVYLKAEGKKNISLSIKKNNSDNLQIKYNGQTKAITAGDFSEIVFDIENTTMHQFSISSSQNNFSNTPLVLVKSIKTQ